VLAGRALTVVAALGLLVGGLELYYRGKQASVDPHPIRGLYVLDQYTGFSLKPSLYRKEFQVRGIDLKGVPSVKRFKVTTTSDGIRSAREFPIERRPGTLRIMAMGSSHTFGYGVGDEDTWPALLQRKLAEERPFPMDIEVINGAVPGTHSYMFIIRYLSRLKKYRPDVVLMETGPDVPWGGMNLAHLTLPEPDPDFEQKSGFYISEDGVLKSHVSLDPLWGPLSKRSALARKILIRIQTTRANAETTKAWADAVRTVDDSSLTPLIAFRDWLQKDSVLLLVVVRQTLHQFKERPTPEAILTRKLARRGIPALNLRPLFEPFENQRTYLVDDGHWNEAGHQVVADAVFSFLRAEKDAVVAAAGRR